MIKKGVFNVSAVCSAPKLCYKGLMGCLTNVSDRRRLWFMLTVEWQTRRPLLGIIVLGDFGSPVCRCYEEFRELCTRVYMST